MSKLTKKPSGPAIVRVAKTAIVAGSLVMVACGDDDVYVGVAAVDSGPDVAAPQPDGGPAIGVPPAEDAGPSVIDVGVVALDVGADAPGMDAPNIGVPPAEDAGPDGFVGI